jgi:hypothetical protein
VKIKLVEQVTGINRDRVAELFKEIRVAKRDAENAIGF